MLPELFALKKQPPNPAMNIPRQSNPDISPNSNLTRFQILYLQESMFSRPFFCMPKLSAKCFCSIKGLREMCPLNGSFSMHALICLRKGGGGCGMGGGVRGVLG